IFSDWEQELGSEMQVMRSVPVVTRARELVALESKRLGQPLELDPTSIDVEVMGKSNVIAVGYVSLEPEKAQIVCRAVMEAYVEYRSTRMTNDRPEQYLAQEITELQKKIDAKLVDRRQFTEQTGVAVPMQQAESWMMQISSLRQRRSELASDLAAAQSLEEAMRRMQHEPDIDLPTFDGVNQFTNEQALVQLKTKVLEQQTRIALLSETLRDDAPEMVGARQTLET